MVIQILILLRDARLLAMVLALGLAGCKDIEVKSPDAALRDLFASSSRLLEFVAHPGWIGHVEI